MSTLVLPITLAETEGMPYIVARCSPHGWNGFHAPRLSPATLADYFSACAAADPNGSWNAYIVTTDTVDGAAVMRSHNCEMGGCRDGEHDHAEDDIVPLDDDGTVFLDGWCWETPRDGEDGEPITATTIVPTTAGTVVR